MRIIFMGSPAFSVPVLDALIEAGHEIAAVYCQPPRPAGRGKKDRLTAAQTRAEAVGLAVRHPRSLRTEEAQADFAALGAEIAVVVAYGLLLPKAVLESPARGCLNIHASILPRWRGAAPIHRAIMAGDAETGVSIMQMEAGLDTGPVLLDARIEIGAEETTGDLHDRLSALGASKIVEALARLDELPAVAQRQDGVTYADKISKSEARVNWSRPAAEVARLIRGLSPVPGAWCDVAGERVKLLGARLAPGRGAPGDVLSGFTIACGDNAVEITRAQRAGKKPASAADVLRGLSLPNRLE